MRRRQLNKKMILKKLKSYVSTWLKSNEWAKEVVLYCWSVSREVDLKTMTSGKELHDIRLGIMTYDVKTISLRRSCSEMGLDFGQDGVIVNSTILFSYGFKKGLVLASSR